MPASTVHPDQVLQALIEKGNRRAKDEKLRKLHEICAQEFARHSDGARDLSLANISRMAESHGLFKARTIYNKQSEDYAALIYAWADYNGPKRSKPLKSEKTAHAKYDFLKKIDDPAVRQLCQIAFVQRDKLKAELNLLKSQTQIVVDMRPLGAEIASGLGNVAVIELAAQLTDSERKALEEAISIDTLKHRKWVLGSEGEVADQQGRFVFLPGFVSAIRKILGEVEKGALLPANTESSNQ